MTDPNTSRPAENAPLDSEEDLRRRWLPTDEQISAGVALLATVPPERRGDFYAIVPLALPGKEFGFWQHGQEVVSVDGVWLAENTTAESAYPFGEAKQAAEQAASAWLREHGRTGTVSTAMIAADGSAAVFEGFLTDPTD